METPGRESEQGNAAANNAILVDGVPSALILFLAEKFATLEAKFGARFDVLDESIKSLSARLDESQKLLRKMRRSSAHDPAPLTDRPERSQSLLSHRNSESQTMRPKTRSSSVKPHELQVSLPDFSELSDTSSPNTPNTAKVAPEVKLPNVLSSEQLEALAPSMRPLQHYFRNACAKRLVSKMKEMAEERTFVAQELYNTEMNYVHTLVTIQTVFIDPLTEASDSAKPILTKSELRDLFGQISIFYSIHSGFLKLLTPLMASWNAVTTQLGVVFVKSVAPLLKVYGAQIDSYSHHLQTIKTLMSKNPEFAKFVADAEKKPECRMQDLQLMMLTVVQRITRYNILLNALQKVTWPGHVDYDGLALANEKIGETTKMVNEKKRESESMKRLLEIQSMLQLNSGAEENLIVAPHRRYIAEAKGFWLPKRKSMHLYLFNDSLLIVTHSNKTGAPKLKQFCGLEGCRMSLDVEPRRIRIDAPLTVYWFEVEDISKKTQIVDHFTVAKGALRTKLTATETVNPRAMFNITHSTGNISETLFNSYRRRPGSSPDLTEGVSGIASDVIAESSRLADGSKSLSESSSSPSGSSPPLSYRSPGSAKTLRKSPSSIDASTSSDALASPKKLKRSASKSAEKRTLTRTATDLLTPTSKGS